MTQFVCFRVTVTGDQPTCNLAQPWREPGPAPELVDEFQLLEAAIECARLVSRNHARVKCERITRAWDGELAVAIDWREPVKKPARKKIGALRSAA